MAGRNGPYFRAPLANFGPKVLNSLYSKELVVCLPNKLTLLMASKFVSAS